MTSSMKNKAQLSAEVILFEDLLAWHVINNFEIHDQGIQELRVAAKKNLPPKCTFINDATIFAIG
jgi:hypothetical protein